MEKANAMLAWTTQTTRLTSRVLLINDVNLSEAQLYYLRRLHQSHFDGHSNYSIVLQNLWAEYGLVFADAALLNSVLAYDLMYPETSAETQALHVLQGNVYRSLNNAIARNEITICHLFVIWFLYICSPIDSVERQSHRAGFVSMLEMLLPSLMERGKYGSRIQALCRFVAFRIRLRRAWDSGGPNSRLHLIDESLPIPKTVPDTRLLRTFPIEEWDRHGKFSYNHYNVADYAQVQVAHLRSLFTANTEPLSAIFVENRTRLRQVSSEIRKIRNRSALLFRRFIHHWDIPQVNDGSTRRNRLEDRPPTAAISRRKVPWELPAITQLAVLVSSLEYIINGTVDYELFGFLRLAWFELDYVDDEGRCRN